MMLNMTDFRKSPSQHLNPSLPDLIHQVFETQHIWSRCSISINSCPTPIRFSHQTILTTLLMMTFRKSPSQPPKKSQVWNITTSKPNTDYQGGQFPPTNVLTLEDCHIRRSQSCLGYQSHLSQNTSSQQLFPLFWKFWLGTNSWRGTMNAVRCRYVWQEN